MQRTIITVVAAVLACATPAAAELSKVESAAEFKRLVSGKTLTRPLVRLTVGANGVISGKGAAWPVTGSWTWKNGYFCRTIEWGGDDLGYNCQQVNASSDRIRFTSDQGAGDSAEFSLR
ncbi:dihydrodipicolinate reductase [Sulfitobacter sp. S223]|uniref:dihydrodipicolinate reductase n=1 Tax=Sulfitobacter sp. S223 TaxID=2867023 RepID=UPI0021A4BC6B|nr:dihydrodipicolinate reductase [Sulfitobacter sp. S223]UWR26105.1 dihydrodipicolinate reductase [Sulfitobacter sp. S223]